MNNETREIPKRLWAHFSEAGNLLQSGTLKLSDDDVTYVPKVECRTCGYFGHVIGEHYLSSIKVCGNPKGMCGPEPEDSCSKYTPKSED
jgi:hypothetical protein